MIHEAYGKDLLLGAILAVLGDPGAVTAWNVTAEPGAILFDFEGRTLRARIGGSVSWTDGVVEGSDEATFVMSQRLTAELRRRDVEQPVRGAAWTR